MNIILKKCPHLLAIIQRSTRLSQGSTLSMNSRTNKSKVALSKTSKKPMLYHSSVSTSVAMSPQPASPLAFNDIEKSYLPKFNKHKIKNHFVQDKRSISPVKGK